MKSYFLLRALWIIVPYLLFASQSVQAQAPFICDGDFYLSLTANGNSTIYNITIDPISGNVVFNGLPGNPGNGFNAAGYRVTDNYIYGLNPSSWRLYRLDSLGNGTLLTTLTGPFTNQRIVAADITPDGQYLVGLTYTPNGGGQTDLIKIDLTSPAYTATTIPLSFASGSNSTATTSDVAFSPISGKLYGYFAGNMDRLCIVDLNTGVIDDQFFPGGQPVNLLGAMFFDAFGRLNAYGTPQGSNGQNTLFRVDTLTGNITPLATGPSASGSDGCSCPYAVELIKRVSPDSTTPCNTLRFTFVVANASGIVQSGIQFSDQFPAGFTISQIVMNPFGGNISSGVGSQSLIIDNMSIPLGIDSMIVDVYVDTLTTGDFMNQAKITNLPLALGVTVKSDNDLTLLKKDSTNFSISPIYVDLPNQQMELCAGDSLFLDGSIHNGVLYEWSTGDTSSGIMVHQPGTYAVTSFGCEIVYDTIIVTALPLPVVTTGPDQTICFGDSIMLSASGATTYKWQPNANIQNKNTASPTVFPQDTAIYTVTGTDAFGCKASATQQVNVLPLPEVEAGPDKFYCINKPDTVGAFTNPQGNYSWAPAGSFQNPNSAQTIFSPSQPGAFTLTLTATSALGCVNQDELIATVFDFQVGINSTDLSCFQAGDGEIQVSFLQGSSPVTYSWTDPAGTLFNQTNNSISPFLISNLDTGNYVLTITDGNGCTTDSSISLIEPDSLQVTTLSVGNVDCFGNANGLVELQAQGGSLPYTFSRDGLGFQASPQFPGLGAAGYQFSVRDDQGCIDTVSAIIKTPTGLFATIPYLKHIDCFGANNAAISIRGNGGTGPYQYRLSGLPFGPDSLFQNRFPGTDTIQVTDQNGCLITVPFTFYQPDSLELTISEVRDLRCMGDSSGLISLSASGGISSYQFDFGNGLGFQQDSVWDGSPAGTFQVIVRDDSLCETSIPVTVTEPPLLEIQLDRQRNVDCHGNNTGEFSLSATGGVPVYLFSFDSLAYGVTTEFTGLSAGNYLVRVQDDSLCIDSQLITITEPAPLEIAVADIRNIACHGDSTGWIHIAGSGGSHPYLYEIPGLITQADSQIIQLPAGGYTIQIVDDSSCIATLDTVITETSPLESRISLITHVDCFENETGELHLTTTGGISPYLYQLNGGSPGTDSTFTNLGAGIYQLLIRDDSLCEFTFPATITEPALLQVQLTGSDVLCHSDSTGQVESLVTGGTAPYEYSWDTNPSQATENIGNLIAGEYEVVVIDSQQCIASASLSITEPDTLVLSHVEASLIEAYCNWENGAAEVVAVGGVTSYEYTWATTPSRFTALAADVLGETVLARVVDRNGCVDTLTVMIPSDPRPIASYFTVPDHQAPILESDQPIDFVNTTEHGVIYSWDFGDGSISSAFEPIHQYELPGSYEVILIVDNKYLACPSEFRATIVISPDGRIYLPNAFSPNGDGINDGFGIMGEGIASFRCLIFDRWGRVVAELTQPDQIWDGRSPAGEEVQEGVYVYQVEAILNDGMNLQRGGSITLIR